METPTYIALSRQMVLRDQMDVVANNLANASTTGFRAELQALRAVPVRGDGASTRVYALETTAGNERPGVE